MFIVRVLINCVRRLTLPCVCDLTLSWRYRRELVRLEGVDGAQEFDGRAKLGAW